MSLIRVKRPDGSTFLFNPEQFNGQSFGPVPVAGGLLETLYCLEGSGECILFTRADTGRGVGAMTAGEVPIFGGDGGYPSSVPAPTARVLTAREAEEWSQAVGCALPEFVKVAARQAAIKEKPVTARDPRKVFVVYGRNWRAVQQLNMFLRSLDLSVIDFQRTSAEMGGIKFNLDVVRKGLEDAQAMVILFTPDEYAALRPSLRGNGDRPHEIQRWQARPNVAFEAGFAVALDPKRTILVTLGHEVEIFSDLAGVQYCRLSNSRTSRQYLRDLLLKGAKCKMDEGTTDYLDTAIAGDFEACLKSTDPSAADPFGLTPLIATASAPPPPTPSPKPAARSTMADLLSERERELLLQAYRTSGAFMVISTDRGKLVVVAGEPMCDVNDADAKADCLDAFEGVLAKGYARQTDGETYELTGKGRQLAKQLNQQK